MKIEDCKTVPEFFGINIHDHIWVEGKRFKVYRDALGGEQSVPRLNEASCALVGCLTGQLKWSKHEPMTADEEKILREIAAWFPWWSKVNLDDVAVIRLHDNTFVSYPFGSPFSAEGTSISKAYEILAPILEKHGEIDLDDYRDTEAEKEEDEQPFGSCDFCGYEFNSELINEYEITHCPKCGEEIEESVDLDW